MGRVRTYRSLPDRLPVGMEQRRRHAKFGSPANFAMTRVMSSSASIAGFENSRRSLWRSCSEAALPVLLRSSFRDSVVKALRCAEAHFRRKRCFGGAGASERSKPLSASPCAVEVEVNTLLHSREAKVWKRPVG